MIYNSFAKDIHDKASNSDLVEAAAPCGSCDEIKTLTSKCSECDHICEECVESHRKQKVYRKHILEMNSLGKFFLKTSVDKLVC